MIQSRFYATVGLLVAASGWPDAVSAVSAALTVHDEDGAQGWTFLQNPAPVVLRDGETDEEAVERLAFKADTKTEPTAADLRREIVRLEAHLSDLRERHADALADECDARAA